MKHPLSAKTALCYAAAAAVLTWASQPPLAWWPLVFIAVAPWLALTDPARPAPRRMYWIIWLAAAVYWWVSLQGIRHAHPVMYLCWLALGGYLAVYDVLFIAACRRMRFRRVPLYLAAPILWVGLECFRNYLLTGISAVMIGHAVADVSVLIQVADLFGTYGVSFILVAANVAVYSLVQHWRGELGRSEAAAATGFAVVLLLAAIGYGRFRLGESGGHQLATIALIQRNEQVEYMQDRSREVEIFRRYADQSIDAVERSPEPIDAVIWPESMFTGGLPWVIADPEARPPAEANVSLSQFRSMVESNRRAFLRRAGQVQSALARAMGNDRPPHLIGGCGVVRYGTDQAVYSGVVHVTPDGRVGDWYGKTHLVMFGEYVPVLGSIPWLSGLLPPGLGLETGSGPEIFSVSETALSPNICIETAVERVTVNQVARLRERGRMPDAVVTVTNDAWFQQSSVVAHHLRCAQLVAVGCRRSILSAANGGPTAWVDSSGRVVRRLPAGASGAIVATPQSDPRVSLYVRLGDWPARLLGLVSLGMLVDLAVARMRQRRAARAALGTDET